MSDNRHVKMCRQIQSYLRAAAEAHAEGDREAAQTLVDAALGHVMKHEAEEALPRSWEEVVRDVLQLFDEQLKGTELKASSRRMGDRFRAN